MQSKKSDQMLEDLILEGTPVYLIKGIAKEEMEVLYVIGYNLYQKKQFDKANDIFTYLCRLNYTEKKYWEALAGVKMAKKEFQSAIEYYSVALMLSPDTFYLSLQIALCHLSLKNLVAAKSILKELVSVAHENNLTADPDIKRASLILAKLEGGAANDRQ